MQIQRESKRESNRSRGSLVWLRPAAMVLLLLFPTHALAVDSAFLRSLIVPGLGQAQQGHYTRSAVFAGAAVATGVGLFLSQIYYREAANKLYAQKHIYASYQETLDDGGVVSIEDMERTYNEMETSHKLAEDRLVWRNAFLVGFAATYAINLVDVLVSKPYDPDHDSRLSVEMTPAGVKVTKAFRF